MAETSAVHGYVTTVQPDDVSSDIEPQSGPGAVRIKPAKPLKDE